MRNILWIFSLLAAAVWGINSESPPSVKMVIISVWIFLTAKLQSFWFAADREDASLIPSLVKWCLLTPTLDLVAFGIISSASFLWHHFFGIFKGAGFWPASVSRCLCIHQYFLGDPFADSVFRVRRKAVPADVVFEGWISRIDGRVCMAHAGLCIRRTFLSRVEKCRPAT